MANLNAPIQGVLDINNVQGNYLSVPLQFKSNGSPIDLTQFVDIKMEIKRKYNVNETAFLTFTLNDGLTISGVDNDILTFVLDEDFWLTQITSLVYDITFEDVTGRKYTYLKGTINNILTASKI